MAGTIGMILVLVGILIQLGFMMIFKVKDVHLGLPSSWFGGRFKKGGDGGGNSIPIHEPYREGFHIKPPWWSVNDIYREIRVLPIDKKEYQVSGLGNNDSGNGGSGAGTVLVSGTIQYRPSSLTLYRFEEVNEEGIKSGLYSEVDQIIGHFLGPVDMETAITRKKEISEALRGRLTGPNINPKLEGIGDEKFRTIFGKSVSYAEHSYGIEIVKVSVDSIHPTDPIKEERDKKQQEKYQKESETIEWIHLVEKMQILKDKFPGLDDKTILEAMQVWKKQATKDIKDFKLSGIEEIIKKFFSGGNL